jgi:hypothetical protein
MGSPAATNASAPTPSTRPGAAIGLGVVVSIAVANLLLHLATNLFGGYGYFRDELYYLACSDHLAFGYVDQPPLSIWLLAASRWAFGDSLFALRLLPALAGAATVLLAGLMARELGGGRLAQALAGLGTLVSLVYLGMDGFFSMNAFDILIWALAGWLVIRLIAVNQPRRWVLLGAVLGLGLLNKVGVLWLGAGLGVGLVLTPQRRSLRTPWPWLAATMAAVLFSPFVIWNATHGWAHLEFIHNATAGKYSGLSPLSFLAGQWLQQNPVTLPLWLAGLGFLAFSKAGTRWRLLAWLYLTPLAILLVNGHSKSEYLAPAYSMLFAAGGVALERWLSGPRLRLVGLGYAVVLTSGLVLTPLALPILPAESYIRYAKTLGIAPSTPEHKQLAELPQFYADMFGWEEKAQAVARVYHALPPAEQEKAVLAADNYGRCGALDFFGRRLGLPPCISGHNNYWIWGPRGWDGEVIVILGGALADKREQFESVEVAGETSCRYCMPYENHLKIYVCRKLKGRVVDVWPWVKHYE